MSDGVSVLGAMINSMMNAVRPYLGSHALTFLARDPSGTRAHLLLGDDDELTLIVMLGELRARHIDVVRDGGPGSGKVEIGTDPLSRALALLSEAAGRFREYERHHRDIAIRTGARTGRAERAERNAEIAQRIESLIVEITPRIIEPNGRN